VKFKRTAPYFVIAFIVFTSFYNLKSLNIGSDETGYLWASKTLAETGKYGLEKNNDFIPYWHKIRVGPSLIVPVAFAIKIFGFNPYYGRYFIAFLTLIFYCLIYQLVKEIIDNKTALLTVFLVSVSFWLPTGDLDIYIPINRYFVGEMLAMTLLTGYLIFFVKFIKSKFKNKKCFYSASIFLALSFLTKMHFLIALIPAIVILIISNIKTKKKIIFITQISTVSLSLFILWLVWSALHSKLGFMGYITEWGDFEGKAFTQNYIRFFQNAYAIFRFAPNTLEPIILAPSLIWSAYRIFKTKSKPLFFILLFHLTWIAWFINSNGYLRYLIPGFIFGTVFVSWIFIKHRKSVFFITLFIFTVIPAFLFTTNQVLRYKETNWVKDIKTYVYKNIPLNSAIETKEFELYELSKDYNLNFTPEKVTNYDPAKFNMGYIIGGSFNGDPRFELTLRENEWEKIYESGEIQILKLQGDKSP